MSSITLTFAAPLNESCQVGDIVHYAPTTSSGGFTVNSSDVREMGQIRQITPWNGSQSQIICSAKIAELFSLTMDAFESSK